MKKLVALLLSLLMLTGHILAEEPHTSGPWEYILTDEGAVLTNWMYYTDGYMPPDVVKLPAELGGQPLVGIGYNALNTYEMDSDISFTLVIPKGVQWLSEDVFQCCHNANVIHFPACLIEIPEGCFNHVDAEIIVAVGNPRYEVRDGFLVDLQTSTLLYTAPSTTGKPFPAVHRLGSGCTENWITGWGEMDVIIPEGVEEIASYAFYDWEAKSLTLPESLRLIETCAFECFNVVELPIVIPQGVQEVQYGAFGLSYQFGEWGLYESPDMIVEKSNTTHYETYEEYVTRTGDDSFEIE